MGLPGSGKTTMAKGIIEYLRNKDEDVGWLNADAIRAVYDDWDFSFDGRFRQARRMSDLALEYEQEGRIVICDFVCPLEEFRSIFAADLTVWMNTIETSRYRDTNSIFEPPAKADYIIRDYRSFPWDAIIAEQILFMVNQ
jgi:adenylylsulfate kinase